MSETVTNLVEELQKLGFSEGFENSFEEKEYSTEATDDELQELLEKAKEEYQTDVEEEKKEDSSDEVEKVEAPKNKKRGRKKKIEKVEAPKKVEDGNVKIELLANVKNMGKTGDILETPKNKIIDRLIEIKVAKIID